MSSVVEVRKTIQKHSAEILRSICCAVCECECDDQTNHMDKCSTYYRIEKLLNQNIELLDGLGKTAKTWTKLRDEKTQLSENVDKNRTGENEQKAFFDFLYVYKWVRWDDDKP